MSNNTKTLVTVHYELPDIDILPELPVKQVKVIPIPLRAPDDTTTNEQLVNTVEQSDPWFSERNRQEAHSHARATRLANQQGLPTQVKLHREQIVKWINKDLAERTTDLIAKRFHYKGPVFCFEQNVTAYVRQDYRGGPRYFVVRDKSWLGTPYKWVFSPMKEFSQIIPVYALEVVDFLRNAGVYVEEYWVADKYLDLPAAKPVSVDPVLFAYFGRHLVSLMEWA